MRTNFFKLNQWVSLSKAKLVAVVLGAALLTACATTPDTVNFEQQNTSFVQVAQNPESFVGSQVRWGGIVARVENLERDTLVEIVNLPLDRQARPLASQQTGGRFIAMIPGFVDPLIYQQGKEITVVGVLNKPMPGKIGQHSVNFPVVETSGHHLWQERPVRQHITVFSSWDPFWFGHVGYRWRYPYYHGYPRYNYCPTHGVFHHHRYSRHIQRVERPLLQQRAAPSPTNVVRPMSNQRSVVNEVERATLRERPQAVEKPRAVTKPRRIREADIPRTPRRIHPKIHRVKIPKPAPQRVQKDTKKFR